MKRFLFIIIVCLVCLVTQAQIRYIVEGGYALSASFSPSPAIRQPLNGAQIDAAIDYRIKKCSMFGIKAGVGYKFVGYYSTTKHLLYTTMPSLTTTQYKESITDHSIYLPIRLTMNYDIKDWTIRVLTGPKMSYHWTDMKYHYSDGGGSTGGESDFSSVYLPFDCTWGVGLACSYNHVYLETGCDFGLYNRTRKTHPSYDVNTLNSREFYLTVGYQF